MGALSPLTNIYRVLQALRRRKYIEGLKRMGMQIGQNVDIIGDFFFDPSHCFLISIGRNCNICPNVRLIAHDVSSDTPPAERVASGGPPRGGLKLGRVPHSFS